MVKLRECLFSSWSRERAVRYYSAKSGESRSKAEGEVDRFITLPGQALQYKLGHMKIQQLRYKAERRLGESPVNRFFYFLFFKFFIYTDIK